MNTNQILDERAKALNALGQKLNEQKDTPQYVFQLFNIAQNFSSFAMQIEALRLTTLLNIHELCDDPKATNKKKVERIFQFVQSELVKETANTTPPNDTRNKEQTNNSIPPRSGLV